MKHFAIDVQELPEGGFRAFFLKEGMAPHGQEPPMVSSGEPPVYADKLPGFCAKLTRRIKAICGEGEADGTTV